MLKPRFLLTAMVALATIALFSFGPTSSALHWAKSSEATTQALPQTPNEPLKNIRFTVYDVGMYPHELQIDAGRVAIAFDDRTGKNSGFVVQRITGNAEKVGEINFPSDRWRTRGEVRLTAGRYRVFSRERSEIQSILIVNP
ncbi:MAG TPA: hypothetical protein VJ784_11960 [Pyrinomonadaceae bacterium]|nr:hypothetical protein [Pyrinomonadaceae bacterium]